MIPEAAVEAARQEMAKGSYQMRPDELPYADAARRVVEAAAPYLMAQALMSAAEAFSASSPEGEYASTPDQVISWMEDLAIAYRSTEAGRG